MSVITFQGKTYRCVPDADGSGRITCLPVDAAGGGKGSGVQDKKRPRPEESHVNKDSGRDDTAAATGTRKKKKVTGAKHSLWTFAEEEKFLTLCLQTRIVERMDGICENRSHSKLFKTICARLNRAALGRKPKTLRQCQSKFSKLKVAYNDFVENSNRNGPGRDHYELLHQLFGERPPANDEALQREPTEKEDEDDASSIDSASALYRQQPETSSCSSESSASSDTAEAEERAILDLVNTFLTHSAEEAKRQDEWFERQMEAQANHHLELIQVISNSISSGIATIANLFNAEYEYPAENQDNQDNFAQVTPPETP